MRGLETSGALEIKSTPRRVFSPAEMRAFTDNDGFLVAQGSTNILHLPGYMTIRKTAGPAFAVAGLQMFFSWVVNGVTVETEGTLGIQLVGFLDLTTEQFRGRLETFTQELLAPAVGADLVLNLGIGTSARITGVGSNVIMKAGYISVDVA